MVDFSRYIPEVSLDVETYSEAGLYYNGEKWCPPTNSKIGGLPAIGAAAYAQHPSTEVLVACYSFDGINVSTWVPGASPVPTDLLDHVASGGIVRAYNSMFEWLIWEHVCRRRYAWPQLPLANTRDTMASARSYGLPGSLGDAAKALGSAEQKDNQGKSLIRWFCIPRRPTKMDKSLRHYLGNDVEKAQLLYSYCAQDVRTEAAISRQVPELSDFELEVWKMDQEINDRGVAIDQKALDDCIAIVEGVSELLTKELQRLTNGTIQSVAQIAELRSFLNTYGIWLPDLRAETVEWVLSEKTHVAHAHPWAVRVLEIRRDLASASVKKLYALKRYSCEDGRARGLYMYYGAERTGRWSGKGIQPHNFPRGDVKVMQCSECKMWQGPGEMCISCWGVLNKEKWCHEAAVEALASFASQDVDYAVRRWGDVLGVVSGSLRALLIAESGKRLICSDFRAIEAVVLAVLAGEQWRIDVFNTHGKIYEMSASKITGIPFEEYLEYKKRTNNHHPTRNAIGKVAELSSGYGGGIGAWKQFGADEHLTDDEIRENVQRWRQESPAIKAMWGLVESAAISAIETPNTLIPVWNALGYVHVHFHSDGQVLRCILPSGRALVYHRPSLRDDVTPWGSPCKRIRFWGHNSNPKYGAMGWQELETYGGRLVENIVQAVSRDILAYACLNLRSAGYHIVMHIHDEVVCEELDGLGSVDDVEARMGDLPPWAKGWPVIAQNGWFGRSYRKD